MLVARAMALTPIQAKRMDCKGFAFAGGSGGNAPCSLDLTHAVR